MLNRYYSEHTPATNYHSLYDYSKYSEFENLTLAHKQMRERFILDRKGYDNAISTALKDIENGLNDMLKSFK